MNRNALIATLMVFSFLCLGASAGDGFASGSQDETQTREDWPTAQDLPGYQEPYSDLGTVVDGDNSNDACEDNVMPGELLRFLHFVRRPRIPLYGDFVDCEDREARDIGTGSTEEGRDSLH